MYYCSTNCQKSDWLLHKFECKHFSKIKFETIADDQIRLFIRILIQIKNKQSNEMDSMGLKSFDTLMDRMFVINFKVSILLILSIYLDYNEIIQDTSRIQQMNNCLRVVKMVMMEEFLQEFQINQLISCFGKMVINTFMISNEDLSGSTGSGIYLRFKKI